MHLSACARVDKAALVSYTRSVIFSTLMLKRQTFSFVRPDPALENLARFEWQERGAFSLYGARIGVQSNCAAGWNALAETFPSQWRPYRGARVDYIYSLYLAPPTRSGRKPFHTLYENGAPLMRSRELAHLTSRFESEAQMAVAQAARGKVFVHAGVVGWRGRAIVMPGRTFTGKSTLVYELVRAGATYYSDEYAALDVEGRVHPFARPLALRDETKANRKISFAELGGAIGKKPLPVGAILVAKYRKGAKWRPRALTPGLGALELLANCVTARSGDPLMLETLSRAARGAAIWKGARGEAREFAAQLLAALA